MEGVSVLAMQCPVDGAELKMSDRQGVEIDYCPQCRGVWLDRGELDKIIDRSEQSFDRPVSSDEPREYEPRRGGEYSRDFDDDDRGHRSGRRRKGWLGDMFEFGD